MFARGLERLRWLCQILAQPQRARGRPRVRAARHLPGSCDGRAALRHRRRLAFTICPAHLPRGAAQAEEEGRRGVHLQRQESEMLQEGKFT